LEALRAERRWVSAAGNATGLACGHRFTLRNFPRVEQNAEHLVLAVDTMIEIEPQRTAAAGAGEPYQCVIEAMSTKVPFRPVRMTPRPFVHGPQTAIVTGPGGEEIYTDQYRRVKVQFHWDRQGKSDANSSCWLRVSQAWAGAAFGAMHIPRIGQEVIVDFLEGDPNQPIITGRIYNAHQMPPHGLPAAAVKSGIKSNSTKGGGGSNELTFDDTKGKENVTLHAQYDLNLTVEHDYNETVKTGNRKIDIQSGTHTETVLGDTKISITAGEYAHFVAANQAQRVAKQSNVLASTDADVYVQAATSIQLHVGESTLWMERSGKVQIKAKDIILDAQTISLSGQTSVETVGGEVNSTAQATHTIKGALVKIN
jgi:type VI secretion system secreted protein VgrG